MSKVNQELRNEIHEAGLTLWQVGHAWKGIGEVSIMRKFGVELSDKDKEEIRTVINKLSDIEKKLRERESRDIIKKKLENKNKPSTPKKKKTKEKTLYDFYPMNLARDIFGEAGISKAYIQGIYDALSSLSEREQKVISLRYKNYLTYENIGYVFSLTKERIRQLLEEILCKLRGSNKCICVSVEEHLNKLDEKLKEQNAILVEKEKELLLIRVTSLENEVRRLKTQIERIS